MKKKILFTVVIVIILLIVLLIFILPYFDFMYVPAGKHWLKEKIADQDNNTGAKTILKVEQGENGEYFVYENRLLYIDNKEGKVSEICEIPEQILGILIKGDAIFLREDNSPYIYKTTQDGIKTKLIDNDGATYMEGKNIYKLIDARLEKYDLNGKKIFSIDTEYNNISCNSLFDEHIFFKMHNEIGLSAPRYYVFDINKIKYTTYTLDLSRYYQFPAEWDSYSEEKVVPFDAFAENIDNIAREGKAFTYIGSRDFNDYELKSIELFFSHFSEVINGYIYLFGTQRIVYRDKDYKEKITKNKNGLVDDEEIQKIECEILNYPIFRIRVEDIKNAKEYSYINYEIVNKYPDIEGIIRRFAIKDSTIYLLNKDHAVNKSDYRNIYVYAIDSSTGLSKKIFEKKTLSSEQSDPEIFCTDNHIFIYEYNNYGKTRITRINRDGSNPVLVIDENGDIVMKPL